ncbi:MAG: helix-turn-helix domain-containing protein [Candidatus Omnitrophica bacterium]|nr:helix-turn-helix domain-containing protein [Candidatus Omnitrophota bacterium]
MPKLVVEMEKAKDKEIMTAKEVAEYLNIHPLTVHKYAREGKIPAFKIGTDWRFHKKYIERWIKEKLASNLQGKERRRSLL